MSKIKVLANSFLGEALFLVCRRLPFAVSSTRQGRALLGLFLQGH